MTICVAIILKIPSTLSSAILMSICKDTFVKECLCQLTNWVPRNVNLICMVLRIGQNSDDQKSINGENKEFLVNNILLTICFANVILDSHLLKTDSLLVWLTGHSLWIRLEILHSVVVWTRNVSPQTHTFEHLMALFGEMALDLLDGTLWRDMEPLGNVDLLEEIYQKAWTLRVLHLHSTSSCPNFFLCLEKL